MTPDLRRVIAVAAHLRATGHLATTVYALGVGETFAMTLTGEGFRDEASGLEARLSNGLEVDGQVITLTARDNVLMDGEVGDERFWLRAGGGSSVTVYVGADFFQYAMMRGPIEASGSA